MTSHLLVAAALTLAEARVIDPGVKTAGMLAVVTALIAGAVLLSLGTYRLFRDGDLPVPRRIRALAMVLAGTFLLAVPWILNVLTTSPPKPGPSATHGF